MFFWFWDKVRSRHLLGEIHPSTPTGFSKNQKLIKKHRTLGRGPRNSCFLSTTWWISWQFLWNSPRWGQMCNCGTIPPILTLRKSYYYPTLSQGVTLTSAGRKGLLDQCRGCCFNTSSCECTMSSLQPTEPGRLPDTRCCSSFQCGCQVE